MNTIYKQEKGAAALAARTAGPATTASKIKVKGGSKSIKKSPKKGGSIGAKLAKFSPRKGDAPTKKSVIQKPRTGVLPSPGDGNQKVTANVTSMKKFKEMVAWLEKKKKMGGKGKASKK